MPPVSVRQLEAQIEAERDARLRAEQAAAASAARDRARETHRRVVEALRAAGVGPRGAALVAAGLAEDVRFADDGEPYLDGFALEAAVKSWVRKDPLGLVRRGRELDGPTGEPDTTTREVDEPDAEPERPEVADLRGVDALLGSAWDRGVASAAEPGTAAMRAAVSR